MECSSAHLGAAGENEKFHFGTEVVQGAHCALEHLAIDSYLFFRIILRLQYWPTGLQPLFASGKRY